MHFLLHFTLLTCCVNCEMCVKFYVLETTGVGAHSTLGTRHFCSKIYVWKSNKMLEFYTTFARKKYFFLIFRRMGQCALPPSPTPMLETTTPTASTVLARGSSNQHGWAWDLIGIGHAPAEAERAILRWNMSNDTLYCNGSSRET